MAVVTNDPQRLSLTTVGSAQIHPSEVRELRRKLGGNKWINTRPCRLEPTRHSASIEIWQPIHAEIKHYHHEI